METLPDPREGVRFPKGRRALFMLPASYIPVRQVSLISRREQWSRLATGRTGCRYGRCSHPPNLRRAKTRRFPWGRWRAVFEVAFGQSSGWNELRTKKREGPPLEQKA